MIRFITGLILIIMAFTGCVTTSPLEKAFEGCENRDGFRSLDYSKRTGLYKVICRDRFEFTFKF